MISRLANRVWRTMAAPQARRFARSIHDPGSVQRAAMMRLVKGSASTAFGRKHHFDRIHNVRSFREQIPLQQWSEVAPWIERIRQGQQGVLTSSAVTRLVPTGGSSGGIKLIPWTKELSREFHAGISAWIMDLYQNFPILGKGPAYWSISPISDQWVMESRVSIGFADDSEYLGRFLAPVVRKIFAAPPALRFIRDTHAFRYATMRCLLATPDLRLISVWHPSFLELLLEAGQSDRDLLTRDIADGTLSVDIPDQVRCAMRPWLKADPTRAHALCEANWSNPSSLWSDLQVVSCWGDGPAALPCADLAKKLGNIPIQPKGLLATEGFVSIPWQGKHPVAFTGHVIEFIDESGAAHWIDGVEEGEVYTIALTTGGGLWRYLLGDRVSIDGFIGRTPCLRFIGRAGATCDLVGEKLDEGFVADCLSHSITHARFAMLAPNADGSAGYTVFSDLALDFQTIDRLDRALAANPQWKLARRLNQLAPLRARMVGTDAMRIQLENLRGRSLGAIKPICLSQDRDWERKFGLQRSQSCPL